jgi:hypothetical protein
MTTLPDKEGLQRLGVEYHIDNGLRRVWVPNTAVYLMASGLERFGGKKAADLIIDHVLETYGLNVLEHVETSSGKGGAWFEQAEGFGIRESKVTAVEEAIDELTLDELAEQVAEKLRLNTLTGLRCLRQMFDNVSVMDKKSEGYGPTNIANTGILGIAVRINDKSSRLTNMVVNGGADKVGEAIEDTLLDAGNYAVAGQLLRKGLWPTVKEEEEFQS